MSKKNYAELIRDNANKMQTLVNTAKEENRELTKEEVEVFNGLDKDIKSYETSIEFENRVSAIHTKLETPVTTTTTTSNSCVSNVTVVSNPPKWSSHGEFFNAVRKANMPNRVIDNRLFMTDAGLENAASGGMSVGVGGDGGFMVGADTERWLMDSVRAQSNLLTRIQMIPVGQDQNRISLPALAETSRADGSRFGGVLSYWAAEAATATANKPKIRKVEIPLEKLLAFCYMTDELMLDARAAESFIRTAYGTEIGFQIDDAIINADGTGKPLGILNSPALISIAKEAGQAADTIVFQNIIKMWSRLGARYRKNAVWLINQEIEPELFSMSMTVGTGGVPVYMPANGISGSPYATLLGKPVIAVEQCSKLGDVGDIILCDLTDYIGIDKGALATDSSIHVQFLYDEMCYRFRYRFNGAPYTVSALTSKANASHTTGPYITIAAR